jgi:hypothetical protein
MIVVSKPWHEILDPERALLTKILGSVKISIDSVLIVSAQKLSEKILGVYKPDKVLMFGVSPETDLKSYERQTLNGVAMIKADDLSLLDDAKKKSLWIAMKQMFAL